MADSIKVYRSLAARAARKYGVPVQIFLRQIQQESGFNPKAQSGAGAEGIAQIVPKWHPGVDPWKPAEALDYAAKLMASHIKQYGSVERALSAYNSGKPDAYLDPHFANGQTYNYVKTIMGGDNIDASVSPGGTPRVPGATPTPSAPQDTSVADAWQKGAESIRQQARANLNDIASGKLKPTESLQQVGDMTQSLIQTVRNMKTPAAATPAATPAAAPAMTGDVPTGDWKKWVVEAKGADRAGVPTAEGVLEFVSRIAQLYGEKLTIGTGTNHNQYVVNTHRESQHWTGHAADIPMSGDALTRLGQEALIAAGMPPKEARKQTGGVYNVGGYQILFNTKVGGNHFNHLHVGVK